MVTSGKHLQTFRKMCSPLWCLCCFWSCLETCCGCASYMSSSSQPKDVGLNENDLKRLKMVEEIREERRNKKVN